MSEGSMLHASAFSLSIARVNSLSATFLKIHLEMEWVDLTTCSYCSLKPLWSYLTDPAFPPSLPASLCCNQPV